jgi:CheY-like chemotaxis protein
MNLLINASEAIGEREGVIHVTTSRVTRDESSVSSTGANVPPGHYVQLEVSDSGCGLTEEAKAKIFDPFFTTKFPGRGLGLAVVQGIVRAHGGVIDVVSVPGQGATFQVLMPCTSKLALAIQKAVTSTGAERPRSRTWTGRTVLLVEDEELLRLAVSKILRKKGFSVVEASDGNRARDLIRSNKEDIAVVLLDIAIPGISSRAVFEEALRRRPAVKVILTSAHSKEFVDDTFGMRTERFIRKPYHLDDVIATIQDALASGGGHCHSKPAAEMF